MMYLNKYLDEEWTSAAISLAKNIGTAVAIAGAATYTSEKISQLMKNDLEICKGLKGDELIACRSRIREKIAQLRISMISRRNRTK